MKFSARSLVAVASFDQEHLADIAHAKLVASGIPAQIEAQSPGFRWNPFAPARLARFTVAVPNKFVKKAKDILRHRGR